MGAPLPKATDRTVDSAFLNRTVNAAEDVKPREILDLIAKEDLPENQVRLHSSLENAHPLVQRAQLYFEKVDGFQNGALELPHGEGYLDIWSSCLGGPGLALRMVPTLTPTAANPARRNGRRSTELSLRNEA
ncbi:MAG: hypothetical protein IPO41_08760 [Acidobacteria bacterium]|nr:hypothetical protein [Acidobacteriota bacterium]